MGMTHYNAYEKIRGVKVAALCEGDALGSPCDRIRVEIREPAGKRDAAEGFLDAYHGEGIQQVVLASSDLAATAENLGNHHTSFQGEPAVDGALTLAEGIGPVSFALVQGE